MTLFLMPTAASSLYHPPYPLTDRALLYLPAHLHIALQTILQLYRLFLIPYCFRPFFIYFFFFFLLLLLFLLCGYSFNRGKESRRFGVGSSENNLFLSFPFLFLLNVSSIDITLHCLYSALFVSLI